QQSPPSQQPATLFWKLHSPSPASVLLLGQPAGQAIAAPAVRTRHASRTARRAACCHRHNGIFLLVPAGRGRLGALVHHSLHRAARRSAAHRGRGGPSPPPASPPAAPATAAPPAAASSRGTTHHRASWPTAHRVWQLLVGRDSG